MSTIPDTIKEKFSAAENKLNGSVPEQLHNLRRQAFDKFMSGGLPARKSEAYKYTDLSKEFARFDNTPLLELTEVPGSLPDSLANGQDVQVVTFINGQFSEEHSTLFSSDELIIKPLARVLQEDENLFSRYYGKLADQEQDPFVSLNSAFASGGVLVLAKKNARPGTVVFRHITVNQTGEGITYARNLVVAEPFSELKVVEQFEETDDHDYFQNALSEIYVAVNAKVQWHKLQANPKVSRIDQMEVRQEDNSRFDLTTLTTEGKVIRNNVRIAVDGQGCETHLYGLYLADGRMHVDNQTAVDHLQPHCESNELYKGILDERAHGVFNGKVFVRKDAQKTNAFQSNKNILLSDNATVNTKPQLEIWADDVKCSHGCTTGQLDEEALFYLRSRGLSEDSARRLMLHAFAIDTMHGIEDAGVREKFEEEIRRKLDS